MSEKPETIDVLCCVTPAGQVVYTTDNADAQRVGRNWRAGLTAEQRAQHEAAHTMGGFVQIRMLREDYTTAMATIDELRELRDSVPRSRIEAMEREIAAAEAQLAKVQADAGAEIERLTAERDRYRNALEMLRPGLELDLRYADPDDDIDALRSRTQTIREALSDEHLYSEDSSK